MLKRRDRLGAYEIVARLKAGGMAQVYLARRRGAAGFTRPVALKLIHPHLADEPEFVRMFVDEATLSARIEAPNVVHVEELGQLDGMWFQAMEYVHGASLAQVVQALRTAGRRCTPELAAHIVAEVAAGLHAAHETTDASGAPLGIVHRDVSPQNVLVSYRGNVKVCDFGIAKAMHRAPHTKSDVLHGKIAYMAPEHAQGKSVDRRADVYALGVILWELLVLERLFEAGHELVLLERVRHPKIDRPSTRVADTPRALDDVVMKMLAVEPADRPQTAGELRRLLLDAVPGARHVESDDVAALLRAVMGTQISEQASLLPLVSESTVLLEMPPARAEESRPDDALRHLTLPAVVVATLPLANAVDGPGTKRRSPARSAPMLLGIACAAALTTAIAVQVGLRAGAHLPTEGVSTTISAPENAPTGGPAPTGYEPARATATATATATGATFDAAAPARVVAAAATTSPIATAPPPHPRRPPPHASAARPACPKVGGVELCE